MTRLPTMRDALPRAWGAMLLAVAACAIERPLGDADGGPRDAGPSPDLGMLGSGDDSDHDTISDADEGGADRDHDGLANYVDLDSDADGVPDALEAGDGLLATPPASCPNEVDPTTRTLTSADGSRYPGDGWPDFLDTDSDNDGLTDGEESALGTDPCALDSDGDGIDDAFEAAYRAVNCPAGVPVDAAHAGACDAPTNREHGIPYTDFYLVLPYGAPAVSRPLDFGTTLRVADVFFLADTTGSMGATLDHVKRTVAMPGGIADGIRALVPDAWVGGGQHDDLPFTPYGSFGDEPFALAAPMGDATALGTALAGVTIHDGADTPEAQGLALWELVTGHGGTWSAPSGAMYAMPDYAGRCTDGGWGAPCFRQSALPVIVHFTDACSHQAPPGEDPACAPYAGVLADAPATLPAWTDVVAELGRHGVKYVGINAGSGPSCAGPTAAGGTGPCYFLRRTAEATGSVDVDGEPLVYDLPGTASTTTFVDTVVGAIGRLATRVPFDVDTTVRGLPAPFGVDARRFIQGRTPGCSVPAPGTVDPCWQEPAGVTHATAVAGVDSSTFFGVVPGTRVTFLITFRNDFYEGQQDASSLFVASIDVRGGGSTVLDTREVFIVIPAKTNPFG